MTESDTLDDVPPPDVSLPQAEAALRDQQVQRALALAQQTAEASDRLSDPTTRALYNAHALRIQARAHWQLGQQAQTFACAVQALPLFRSLHDREVVIDMQDLAALALCASGLAEDALPMAQLNVDFAAESPLLFDLLSQSLSTLAHVYAVLGKYEDAELMHLQALSRARESSDPQTVARAYANALLTGALAYDELMRQGQPQQALTIAQRQLKFAHQAKAHMDAPVMSSRQRAMMRLNIGLILCHAGRLDEAQDLLDQALQLAQDNSPEGLVQGILLALGECALERGDIDTAEARLAPLLHHNNAHDNATMLSPLLRNGIRLRHAQGQAEQAERLTQRLAELEADQARCRASASQDIKAIQRRMLQLLQPMAPVPLSRY